MSESRIVLPGSHREPAPGVQIIGPANEQEQAHVTVYVRGKDEPLPPSGPEDVISREEYTALYGASASDFQSVIDFGKSFNLTASNENAFTRSIELHGTLGDLSRAFGANVEAATLDDKVIRHRVGSLTVPEKIGPVIEAVFGLDNRPADTPHVQQLEPKTLEAALAAVRFSPVAIGQMYNFPTGLDGTGQTIAVIELGGGIIQSDLTGFFSGLGIAVPSITPVVLPGGSNTVLPHAPVTDAEKAIANMELEVALDIQIIGALAPKAKQIVYFTARTEDGFLAGFNAAISASPAPAVVSISWGGPENLHTVAYMQKFSTAIAAAAKVGIPVCCSSGDNGSFADIKHPAAGLQVGFPAVAPCALACGGTTITVSGGKITSEVTWNGSGGGVSRVFAKPTYQSGITIPPIPGGGSTGGRGVPDVSADADPNTGYQVKYRNADVGVGGTSAVSPLWAALIARVTQSIAKPIGFLNDFLYDGNVKSKVFRDITSGNNDVTHKGQPYSAGTGWDACTGLGVPDGTAFLNARKSAVTHPGTGSTGIPNPIPPGTGTHGSTGAPPDAPEIFPFPPLPPIQLPPPVPPAPPSLTFLLGGGSNSVALVGVVGLAAIAGLVAATGIVATVAISKEK